MSYELIKHYDNQHIHLQFEGRFHGQIVLWDTHFFTLDGYNLHKSTIKKSLKQFISIEPSDTNIFKLTIGLKIHKITEPSIQMMMIMVKQYKNLALGHHEYG